VQYEYWNAEKNQAAGNSLLRIILTKLDSVVFIKSHISFEAWCKLRNSLSVQVGGRDAGLIRTVDM